MARGRRGVVLLEVLVALTVLLLSGVTVLSLLGAALRNETLLSQHEATLMSAERMLVGLSLLDRTDLDRRLGSHPAGAFVADVRRPEPSLYRIAIRESDTATVELLATVVHRPSEGIP